MRTISTFVICSLLLCMATTSCSGQEQEEIGLDPVDQMVAAGIRAKLKFTLYHVTGPSIEVEVKPNDFTRMLKSLNLDTQLFSDTETGKKMAQDSTEIISLMKYVMFNTPPLDKPKYLPILKSYGIDPVTPDANKLADLMAKKIRSYSKRCRLPQAVVPEKKVDKVGEHAG